MSGLKAKKSSKGDQIPKPISIKKEKMEEDRKLHPMSHYIDDRLELVKQIFGTLKPKTILNLAPEFLKKTPLDEIEELCLEELLCLSTKRLKSIIENTKCPTDTESSEDSDVEHKEEHISLEEISSDSDIGQESRKTKKKIRSKKTNNGNENKESGGQMSVLELLELQARARAIRSQLAMEPITKIEVKSDDDIDELPVKKVQRKEKEKRSPKKTDSGKRKSQESARATPNSQPDSSSKEQEAPRKRIKIKRNYRQTSKSPEKERKPPTSAPETLVASNDLNKLPRSKSRSASPDVITIQTEPETLLISDSTDDETTKKKTIETTTTKQVDSDPPAPVVESEPEEGEVRDEPEEPAKVVEPANPEEPTESEAAVIGSDRSDKQDKTGDKEKPSEEAHPANPPAEPKKPIAAEPTALDDEDQNDDVISIGGDLEMIEEMTKDDDSSWVSIKSEKKEKMQDPEELDNDVISLGTSEDERDKLQQGDSESWRSRYMKSSKVSQVLAESRLGKRVRDKLKKSKRSKVTAREEQAKVEKPDSFTSKHEDGSIEQYQELLQHRQRKTSNSSKGDT
ncbi:neurofilament medium polypeptide isoform X1 [Drosophila sechellia]|uniref:GM25697 n=1 Tax=Drosophila sechellia TaxID=7238 RepID=B4HKS4_DROSE|nr:neurofilament medium polypeptide isoform X1 [Drosophila sechellia]EDW41879.1 GM25697 [Drosophila sechellia]